MLCVEKEEEASEGDGGVGLELEEMGCVGGLREATHTAQTQTNGKLPIRPLRCLSSDPFGRKVALKHMPSTQ